VAGIKSVARKDGDDYVITGQKMWITNSLQADWMCMLVNTGEGPQHKNKSLVMVPMRDGPNGKLTKGIEVAQKIRKIGMNSSDTGLIYFDEVRVPQRNRIGAEGPGLHLPDAAVPGRAPVGGGQLPAKRSPTASSGPSSGPRNASCSAPPWRTSSGFSSSWPNSRPRWKVCAR
jgi:alkylation response protein AidB-like acyl-CoA dehydrogenase